MTEELKKDVDIVNEESSVEKEPAVNGEVNIIEEAKVDIVNENETDTEVKEIVNENTPENIEEMEGSDMIDCAPEREVDRDSLVPGTGSINGDIGGGYEDDSDEGDDEDENMSNVVQGTTETILNKLEENLAQAPEVDESDLLQVQ